MNIENILRISFRRTEAARFHRRRACNASEMYCAGRADGNAGSQRRKDVIRAARALNDVENVTIILITHYMEEVIYADRVFVMDEGKVVMQGTPRRSFPRWNG